MNKNELDNFRNTKEIDFKNIIVNEFIEDKNEIIKFKFLKQLRSQGIFKDIKNDENFINLIIYLVGKEKKEEIDLQLLYNYLLYLNDIVVMLKNSDKDFDKILYSFSKNLTYEKLSNNQLIFRQG